MVFGTPSAPGALYGLSRLITCSIWVSVMGLYENFGVGYVVASCAGSVPPDSRKNALLKALLFSSLNMASLTMPLPSSTFRVGTQAFPPSEGSPDAYLCAVQTVLSSMFCRKASQ